jgi:hypothetical protein
MQSRHSAHDDLNLLPATRQDKNKFAKGMVIKLVE